MITCRDILTGQIVQFREGTEIDWACYQELTPVRIRSSKQPALVPADQVNAEEHEKIVAVRSKGSGDLAALYEDDVDPEKHETEWPRGAEGVRVEAVRAGTVAPLLKPAEGKE